MRHCINEHPNIIPWALGITRHKTGPAEMFVHGEENVTKENGAEGIGEGKSKYSHIICKKIP